MTDREKHLSLALDALVQLEERIRLDCNTCTQCHVTELASVRTIRGHIEAAAMPKPSIIRRWFGKREAA